MDQQAPPGSTPDGSLVGSLAALATTLLGLVRGLARLAALETRLAGLSLAAMVALALAGAFLGATAWLALLAALVVWLARFGLAWELGLLLVAALNLLAGLLVARAVVVLSRNLTFPVTRRHLGGEPPPLDTLASGQATDAPDKA